jgi:hypothetical protein
MHQSERMLKSGTQIKAMKKHLLAIRLLIIAVGFSSYALAGTPAGLANVIANEGLDLFHLWSPAGVVPLACAVIKPHSGLGSGESRLVIFSGNREAFSLSVDATPFSI